MITETISYTDFDGNDHVDQLWFHISEATLVENLGLLDELQAVLEIGREQEKRTLTTAENQSMMDLLRKFMMLSYGLRTEDGGFDQDDPCGSGPIWKKFRSSSAYSAFVMSLFQPDPSMAAVFMFRCLPASLQPEVTGQSLAELPPDLRKKLQDKMKADAKRTRIPRGTRIVDDVSVTPALAPVPDSTDDEDDEDEVDWDRMLEEAEDEADSPPAKKPISQKQYDLMAQKLSARPDLFAKFMDEHELVTY